MKGGRWQIPVGIAISLLLLYLVFGRVDLRGFLEAFHGADYLLLLPVVGVIFGNMALRALRWNYLLSPVKKVHFSHLLGTLFIGFMANNLLPARMGDVARGYLLGKLERMPKTSSFATLVAEKLLDGITVLSSLFILSFAVKNLRAYPSFKKALSIGGYISLGLFVITLVALFLIKERSETFMRLFKPSGWSENAKRHLYSFRDGLLWSERWDCLLLSVLYSYLTWGTYALAIYLTCLAFGLRVPLSAPFLVMVAICLGTVLPITPGYIGTYHAAVTYSLLLYRVPMETAAAISLVFHALYFLPTTLVGFFYLWRYQLTFSALRDTASS
ncbi:MAG: hypothetical protein DRG55_00975 [Deltaproteobacteria bacterium]|nr:MAG: hypothetical protein DRG55_00975 [Deltaproteobacteria bacterium]